nr:MAG TPA: tail tape measure protein [Caudoviricetes sp.]
MNLMASLGMDTSAYEQGIEETKNSTKQMVASLSKEYTDLQKQVNQTAIKYNEQVKATGAASKESKELLTQLRAERERLSEVQQALNNADTYMKSFKNSTKESTNEQKNFIGMLTGAITKANILSNITQTAVSKVKDFAVQFVQTGISYNEQIEKYTTGFTNMLGSAQAAQEAMQAIQEDAARTPFDVASLTQANQLLISAGENAEYSRKVINALGDAVSATGGSSAELSRMAANLQQIANVGKAATIDIKQFAYAGINIYQILADYTGKSVQEVQKMTISYDLLSQALIAASEEGGRYYNAMNTQSQTLKGRTDTLKDNVSQLAGLLTGNLTSALGGVISKLNEMVLAAQDAYKLDGWSGLIGEITGLTSVIDKAKSSAVGLKAVIDALKSGEIGIFHGDWDAVYKKAFNSDQESKKIQKESRKNWDNNHSGMVWDENDGWVPAKTSGTSGTSIVTSPSGSSGKSTGTKSKTETVIASVSHTATTTAQNALGAVTTSVETLQEKVKDAAGNIKNRVTETTTETGKEMVNGVATTYKKVTKTVDGVVQKETKVYDDMSKTLLGTLTTIAEKTFNGITTTTQQAVETYADGSQQIKTTATETGERIVDGVRQTYTKVISYIDGVQDKVTETAQNIDKSIKATQKRIDENLSKAQQQFNSGIFKLGKNLYTDLKNQDWAALSLDIVNMMWGEVSQEQREALSDWANKALEVINEAYSGGGLSEAYKAFKQIMTNGIKADADGVTTSVDGLSKVFQDFGVNVSDVGSKIMSVLDTIGSGMGSFALNAGTDIANLAGSMGSLGTIAEGAGGLLAKVGSLIMANPEVAAVVAIVAGVAALGAALYAKFGKGSSGGQAVSHYESPYAGHDVYDSLTEFSTRAAMQHRYMEKTTGTDAQLGILQQIRDMLDEHLPDIGTGQLVMDGEKVADMLTPRLATNMDTSMGVYTLRAERGV